MSSRTTTECVQEDEAKDLFVWSVARDPVEKFQSGVRQAWLFSHGKYSNLSADELMSKQLQMPLGQWVNEHLQPNTFRMTGQYSDGAEVRPLTLSA